MTATTDKIATHSISLRDSDLQLKDVIKTIPKECFEKNRRKAWTSVLLSIAAAAIGYLGIATFPWYLLPIAWIFTGTALTGWFVVAHDCGHRSFAKRRWVNDLVGHVMMLPLLYPFHSWRIMHDHHHLHTNKMDIDNAWHPWEAEAFLGESTAMQATYRALRGRLWFLASIAHWAVLHFVPSGFEPRDRQKIRTSVGAVLIFAAIFFPVLFATTGFWGVVKFWLMPWLVYHFWMSTFTLVHHTAPDIQFYPAETWNAVDAQLAGTVHCDYPKWVEVLCHDINVHIPHHLSVAIPSYNLRLAHKSLQENWAEHLKERTFSWGLMKEIVDYCHLYHPENAYQPFKALEK